MLTLYDHLDSGNGYKVRLLLHHLAIPFRRIECDIDRGDTRTAAFLAINPNGRIPTLVLEDGSTLAESNAILWYLADGSPFLPASRADRARTLQWMFFEQYSHEPFIAVLRHWLRHGHADDPDIRAQMPAKRRGGAAALAVMETHLAGAPGFTPGVAGAGVAGAGVAGAGVAGAGVAGGCGLADIALYAYTHVADQGGFDLSGFPNVRAWLARVAGLPRHIGLMDDRSDGAG